MKTRYPWADALKIKPQDYESWTVEAPKSEPFTFWCLERGKIRPADYFAWAKDFYSLPLLKEEFFKERPNRKLWKMIESVANWSPSMLPLAEWDGVIFIGCVEPPVDVQWSFQVQYVLASPRGLKTLWQEYRGEETIITQSHPAVSRIDISKIDAVRESASVDHSQVRAKPTPAVASASALPMPPPLPKEEPSSSQAPPPTPSKKASSSKPIEPPPFELKLPGPAAEKKPEPQAKPLSATMDKNPSEKKLETTKASAASPSLELDLKLNSSAALEDLEDQMLRSNQQSSSEEAPKTGEEEHELAPPEGFSLDTSFKLKLGDDLSSTSEDPIEALAPEGLDIQTPLAVAAQKPTGKPIPTKAPEARSPQGSLEGLHTEDLAPESLAQAKTEDEAYAWLFRQLQEYYSSSMILLNIQGHQLQPYKWEHVWKPVDESALNPISTQTPSLFRIVSKTKMPYHGAIIENELTNVFFKSWGYKKSNPEHATAVPLLIDDHLMGIVLAVGEKEANTTQALAQAERSADQVTQYLKAISRKAA